MVEHVSVVTSTDKGQVMKKQARHHGNRKLSGESDRTPAKRTGAVSGEFVTELFETFKLSIAPAHSSKAIRQFRTSATSLTFIT
jgi:hypothetical protein